MYNQIFMKKSILLIVIFSLAFLPIRVLSQSYSKENGSLKLSALIGDNMVLQQQQKDRLWGESVPNAQVVITSSWNKSVVTKTNSKGRWEAFLTTPSATVKPQSITIKSNNKTITISNILIGEVWFCSGQSNMQMPLMGFDNCPIKHGNKNIALSSTNTLLRYYTVKRVSAKTPNEYCQGDGWKTCNPKDASNFGAVAYYFGSMLSKSLNIPVGIINCSWGGSKVEGWLPNDTIAQYKDVKIGEPQKYDYLQPCIMYNGMLAGASKYSIKGYVWYQGESNVGCPDYAKRLSTMVNLWRKMWGDGNLPFYEVEIAPFLYGGEGDRAAYLREEQYNAQKIISNCYMISTNDLVEPFETHQIHPMEKEKVGERLCYMALVNTYNSPAIGCRGPEYKKLEVKDNKAYVFFDNAQFGFNRQNGINGFEIAGDDREFHPATATVDYSKNCVVVTASEVAHPVAVRYCFRNFQIGNLYNTYELPTVPFRTDNW